MEAGVHPPREYESQPDRREARNINSLSGLYTYLFRLVRRSPDRLSVPHMSYVFHTVFLLTHFLEFKRKQNYVGKGIDRRFDE